MNCHRVQANLDALCDGELSRWMALRVKRHLRHCSACTALGEETARMGERMRIWRDQPAPEEWHRKMSQRALPIAENLVSSPPAPYLFPIESPLRLREKTTMKRLSLACAVLAAAGVLAAISLRPSPAYAQLQRMSNAFLNLKSAHFVGWRQGPNDTKIPLELWFAEPNRSWQKSGDELEISDGAHVWRYREGGKAARRQPFTPTDRAAAWKRMFTLDALLQSVQTDPNRMTDLGRQTVNGESLRVIRLNGPDLDRRVTFWVDPDTNLIRKFLEEQSAGPEGETWRVRAASERIEYDVTPPADRFAFTPEPGMRVFDLPPGRPGSFVNRLSDGQVIASRPNRIRDYYNPEGKGAIDLMAFTRSESGIIFVVWKGDPGSSLPGGEPEFTLTDSAGRSYAGREFGSAGSPKTGYTWLFFPEGPVTHPEEIKYRLVYSRPPSGGGKHEVVAAFEGLPLSAPPPDLDALADAFAGEEMRTSIDYLRHSTLGLAAFHKGRMAAAEPHLKSAISLAPISRYNDHLSEAYLALADVYLRSGRNGETRALLNRLYATWQERDGRDHRPVLDAAERMARAGDRGTALRWLAGILNGRRGGHPPLPGEAVRAAKMLVEFGGDPSIAIAGLVRSMRDSHPPGKELLGSEDARKLGETFEMLGWNDLALEAYTRGLETSGILKQYREDPEGWAFRKETEAMIAAVRRLGGDAAVRRLEDRSP
ncbi:MAG: zf-HC2 domain-containing protein [Armatimonadetes bacterium]|nr:zf-HC2 domain-containing protein [Armatimonadota bacterium]